MMSALAELDLSLTSAKRLGFSLPEVLSVDLTVDTLGTVRGVVNTKAAASVRIAASTSGFPDAATVRASNSLTAVGADGAAQLGSIATIDYNQALHVSVLAYEQVNGTGAESQLLGQARIDGSAALAPAITAMTVAVNHVDGSIVVRVEANAFTQSYRWEANAGDSPSWPTDGDVEAGTVRTITGADGFTIAAGSLTPQQRLRIRVAPYRNNDGTGAGGATDHGDIVNAEADRLADVRAPYPLPAVKKKSQSFGTTDTTSTKVDVSLQIEDSMGASTWGELRVWTEKASVAEPDPTGSYEGSASIPLDSSGLATVTSAQSFTLNPGPGTDTLLSDIRVPAGDTRIAKVIYAQVIADDGRVGPVVAIVLSGKAQALRDDGKFKRDVPFVDGDYAMRADDPAGEQFAADVYLHDTNLIIYGSSASPSTVEKPLYFSFLHATTVVDLASVADRVQFGVNYAYPQNHKASPGFDDGHIPMVFPKGVTLTGFEVRGYRSAADSDHMVQVEIGRVSDSDGTVTTILTLTQSGSGWVTTSGSCSEVVGTDGQLYVARVKLRENGGALTDTRFLWIKPLYDVANLNQTY